ncbi:ubiquitin-conjugating enzyme E2 32 [Micractinium conductrix]|uniref:Ubiquitin-conjugating enzyme E2 32 n=1 Tax=Micractinium conductrix TaxID=554055 RepID=A0A2P6VLV8_9CHLO|nr:ubiquitin-conjugating enzyme E2 32 [Micractinium conductrix]|eukprot:PSC75073.1 ubiquitin-conjugating enzyme E2 32 [Micractinium conductrix]
MAAWNSRNPAVKRIVQELKELQRDDDPNLLAEALEENIFEWHFVIRGAWDSEFEGGIYHGRILMPAEYPFKPPAFMMLTPSGRFETGIKICLSISSHHPESWQPSWSVRSALVALIAFMQTPGNGALGSLDHPVEAKRSMAAEARAHPPTYGSADRQRLIAEMHQKMLDMEERSRALCFSDQRPTAQPAEAAQAAEAAPAAAQAEAATEAAAEATAAPAVPSPSAALTASPTATSPEAAVPAAGAAAAAAAPPAAAPATPAAPAAATATPAEPEPRARPAAAAAASPWGAPAPVPVAAAAAAAAAPMGLAVHHHPHQSWEDRGLTYLAVLLGLAIAALVIRKVLVAFTFHSDDLYTFHNHVEGVEL